jgi:hypothetical protein
MTGFSGAAAVHPQDVCTDSIRRDSFPTFRNP